MPNTPGGLAHVETAFIVKELRGQGYGQKLYLAAAAEVKKRGYRGVASVVSHGRSADANALWRRLERTGRVRAETTGRFHVPLQVLERRR
jgi:GNAT superfamily N-acetyltransferase